MVSRSSRDKRKRKMSTWGILGCGTIANEMAETFIKMGHEIYGVSNRTLEKAEKFAETYGVKHVFKTYEEMLADEKIDIIYIATPHSRHYENMMQAVKAGKHVLCEKAITVNAAQLELSLIHISEPTRPY